MAKKIYSSHFTGPISEERWALENTLDFYIKLLVAAWLDQRFTVAGFLATTIKELQAELFALPE